jgi:hypothetical protein
MPIACITGRLPTSTRPGRAAVSNSRVSDPCTACPQGKAIPATTRFSVTASSAMALMHRTTATKTIPVRPASASPLAGLTGQIITRLMKLLTRRCYLVEEQGMIWLVETDMKKSLASLHAASCTYRPEGAQPATGARAHTWPGGPDALGTATEARYPHRSGALRLRWAAEDPRRDRRTGGDREDPHDPEPGRVGTAVRGGEGGVLPRLRSLSQEPDDGTQQYRRVYSARDGVRAPKRGGWRLIGAEAALEWPLQGGIARLAARG